jgi:transcriptional regulator with XRE-family HTH domain
MHIWLGRAAQQVRESAGPYRYEVASKVPCDPSVLANFEKGRSLPQGLDRVLDAYAEVGGLSEGRDLWRLALKLWNEAEPPRR